MKYLMIAAVIAVLILTLAIPSYAASQLKVGDEAPNFTLETHDGKSFTLEKLEGKRGAVLVFFATWCPACMAEVPTVKNFVEKSRDQGVLVYGVNFKQPKRIVEKFVEERELNYRVLLDTDGAVSQKQYKVTGIPLIVAIDADGIIQYVGHHIPKDQNALIEKIAPPKADAAE